MSDDYLFDKTGSDPEVEHLEAVLSPYRYRPRRQVAAPVAALALAAVVLLGLTAWWFMPGGAPTPWSVQTASCDGCVWNEGERLDTSAAAIAHLSDRGRLEAAPGTDLRLDQRVDGVRLTLGEGRIDVMVDAPARWLQVRVPGVEVVDLGCAYTLVVAPDGTGGVAVRSGSVALEGRGHPTLVPAGGAAATWPNGHTGLPVMDGASTALVEAVDGYDRGVRSANEVLQAAERQVDALTLWHLLARVPAGESKRQVAVRMAALIPEGLPHEPDGLADPDDATLDALLGFIIGRTL